MRARRQAASRVWPCCSWPHVHRFPCPLVCVGLYQFISNFSDTVSNVSGPVAILAVGAEVARSNAAGLYQFAALVNINLAVVNILPLPALDGGCRCSTFFWNGCFADALLAVYLWRP